MADLTDIPGWRNLLEQLSAILRGGLEVETAGEFEIPDSLQSIWSVILPIEARQPETAELAQARLASPWKTQTEQYVRLATGRFSEAAEHSPLAPEHVIALWTPRLLLLNAYADETLTSMRDRIQRWDPMSNPLSKPWSPITEVLGGASEMRYPYHNQDLKSFAAAMISWALGDADGVDRGISTLTPTSGYDSTWTASAANLLRALKSLEAGDLAAAHQYVGETTVRHWYQPTAGRGRPVGDMYPYYQEHMSRFLRAEILLAEGRFEEAMSWYQTLLDDPDVFAWPAYFAPSIYKHGVCNEGLGRYEEALSDYRDFIGLWSKADPELQLMVDEARAGVERIERIAASEQ